MSTFCRTCKAPIFWAVTPSGKQMPIDVTPSPSGTLVLRTQAGDDGVEVLDEPMLALDYRAVAELAIAGIPAPEAEPRFVSHFATCAQAAQHRKPKP